MSGSLCLDGLNYWQIPKTHEQLLSQLRISPAGASFRNLRFLETWGLSVVIRQAEIQDIRAWVSQSIPVITFVYTGELSYWREKTAHAVVVVDVDEDWIYLNDPAFLKAPQRVSWAEFYLAWFEMDQFCAIVTG